MHIIGPELELELDTSLPLKATMARAVALYRSSVPSHIELYHKDRIRNYIEEQLRDPNLSVESIAQAVGL